MTSRIVSIIALCVLLSDARKFDDGAKDQYWNEIRGSSEETKELYETIEVSKRSIELDDDRDVKPSHIQNELPAPALLARHVVNQADWAAVATISTRKDVESFPVANLISIADGPVGNGTGVPYMYLTPLDYTAQDLCKDHRATLMVSLAQGNYCKGKGYDPMDPRCARVMLTGKIVALKNETEVQNFVKKLFFARHPTLVNMPPSHNFFFAELKISTIAMLYTFGGPRYIPVEDYFNPPVTRSSLRARRLASPFISKPIF